jgi:RNA polymerase sigma factor (sigma-70 family)
VTKCVAPWRLKTNHDWISERRRVNPIEWVGEHSALSTRTMLQLLHETHESQLLRFFRRRLSCREDAADATQETFLRMLNVPSSTVIENPQAYLFQVAKSVARVVQTRQARDGALFAPEVLGLEKADDAPLPDQIVSGRQALLLMAKSIEELPSRCQQVFILSRLHGLSNSDIAAHLQISRNMVEKHIIKALLHCRKARAGIFL